METLQNKAIELSLYCNQPYSEATSLKISVSNDFYKSKAFEDWKNGREGEQKMAIAIIERIDGLAKQINGLSKLLSKSR